MRMLVKIKKWGNSLGVRLVGLLTLLRRFIDNRLVDAEVSRLGYLGKSMKIHKPTKLLFTEAQLIRGLDKATSHADLLAPPVANEQSE